MSIPPKIRDLFADWGRKGGAQGGRKRARTLSPERRKEIAKKAASARWKGHRPKRRSKKKPT